MLNFLLIVLILAVGLALISSILWNRLVPHLGTCLIKTKAHIQFPLSKSILLELKKTDNPKRVILKFNKSIGFYNGEINLRNGESEIGRRKLPILPEYRNNFFKFYNEDIPRQTNTVIILLQNYKAAYPLILNLNLNHNIQSSKLKEALDVVDNEEIEVFVRG